MGDINVGSAVATGYISAGDVDTALGVAAGDVNATSGGADIAISWHTSSLRSSNSPTSSTMSVYLLNIIRMYFAHDFYLYVHYHILFITVR